MLKKSYQPSFLWIGAAFDEGKNTHWRRGPILDPKNVVWEMFIY